MVKEDKKEKGRRGEKVEKEKKEEEEKKGEKKEDEKKEVEKKGEEDNISKNDNAFSCYLFPSSFPCFLSFLFFLASGQVVSTLRW